MFQESVPYAVYHNIKVKYCRTSVNMERRIKGITIIISHCCEVIAGNVGTGLSCHRIISTICNLAGIKDARAKIIGSTNPLNIVRATMKGLTSQV